MPRPRSFDQDDVLDRAFGAFWRQGYEATSMQDLIDSMGISRASLYNAFGSKHALFIEVLKHYRKQRMDQIIDRLRDPSQPGADTIRAALEQSVNRSVSPEGRSCLMTHTAMEMCARGAACAKQVEANFACLEAAFAAALERGQAAGDLTVADPQATAYFLTNTLQGLQVMTTTNYDEDALRDVIHVTMQAIQ